MSISKIEDDLFGELTISIDDGGRSCSVDGERLPKIVLRRDGATTSEHVPIGTRNAADLSLSVDGTDAVISPGPGKYSRRSYRVSVKFGGAHYLLAPNSATTSKLLRDGRLLGVLSAPADQPISAEWTGIEDTRPEEAAIGYALAASFGVGAKIFVLMLIDGILDALPG